MEIRAFPKLTKKSAQINYYLLNIYSNPLDKAYSLAQMHVIALLFSTQKIDSFPKKSLKIKGKSVKIRNARRSH